jgi:hypothetical protein
MNAHRFFFPLQNQAKPLMKNNYEVHDEHCHVFYDNRSGTPVVETEKSVCMD